MGDVKSWIHRAVEYAGKVAEDIHDGFWRGVDKLLYG